MSFTCALGVRRLTAPFLPLVALALLTPCHAQTASPASRIVQPIDPASRITLRGNVHPLPASVVDKGAVSPSLPAERLVLVLSRSARQEAELQTYLQAVQDPGSADYHKWLSPQEFGSRFGVSDGDLATTQAWLQQQGFRVDHIAPSRMAIEFSGTFGQVESAFQTSLHTFDVAGTQHWANTTDPQIPASLAPVVAGVAALNNFSPRSMAVRGPSGAFQEDGHRIRPALTQGSTTSGYLLYVTPADAATIYNTPTTLNPKHSGTLYDGTGATIGIAGDSNIDVTQNANYRATFGLPVNPTTVVVDGTDPGVNGDAVEAYLDTQVAGGIAPKAHVILYTATDTYLNAGLLLAIGRALDDNQVDILNVSFGSCEAGLGTSANQYIYNLWQQAAAQGISVTVSTGDSGSAGCDNPNTETSAQYGLAVNGLASTPYNIAVGGTDFDALYQSFPSSFTKYVDVTNTNANHRSALGYIPEKPWNDSTAQGKNGLLSSNLPWSQTNYPSNVNIVAAGGGASTCVTTSGTSCTAGYPVPTWQASAAASNVGRNVPDVSLLAGNGLYGATWALCTDQDYISATQTQVDCAGTPITGANFNVTGVGGTSAAAPAFAGILALAVQKTGGRVGQVDRLLYNLASTRYSTVFHDVTAGNNSVACISGSPNCSLLANSAHFLSGFDTKTGYDEASGLGSVDATQLLSSWSAGGSSTASTSSLTLNGGTAALSITHGAAVNVGVQVSGSPGTPSGPVALVDDMNPALVPNSGAIGSFALAAGTANGVTYDLPGGSYHVSAHYGGDSTFAASDSNSIAVTVAPEDSSTDLKVRGYYDPATGKASATPYHGYLYLIDAQPYGKSASAATPNGAATGTVSFTSGTASIGTAKLGSDGVAELQTGLIPPGVNSLKASFPGDASFNASTSSAVSLTVQPALSSLALASDQPGYTAGGTAIITATFNAPNSIQGLNSIGAAPTGTVSFLDGTTFLGSAAVTGAAGSPTSFARASANLTITHLTQGAHTITASYSGDANYASSKSLVDSFFRVSGATTILTIAPISAFKVNQGQAVSATLSTSAPLPAPTGIVTFTVYTPDGYPAWAAPATISGGAVNVSIPANVLPLGTLTLTAVYSGDTFYSGQSVTALIQVNSSGTVTPTLSLTLPANPISGALPVKLAVSGPTGSPVPTGPVTISGSVQRWSLTNGAVSFTSYNSLPQPGPNTITVTYLGDSTYTAGTASGTVILMGQAPLSFSPMNPTVNIVNPITLTVGVGTVTGLPVPTGTISLTSDAYSGTVSISGGTATFTVPAGSLPAGGNFMTANYSGDSYYFPSTASTSIYVTSSPMGFSVAGNDLSVVAGATTNNTTAIGIWPGNGFYGQVNLGATITSRPAGATIDPAFSFGATSPVTVDAVNGGQATLTVITQSSSTAALPHTSPAHIGWAASGESLLASLLLMISPRRRQRWRTLLGLVLLCVSFSTGLLACGGGGPGSSTPPSSTGTSRGIYTVRIDAASGSMSASSSLTLTVR